MTRPRRLLAVPAFLLCLVPGAAAADDAATETFLLEARVVSMEDLRGGVTRPKRVTLERDGERRSAVFKTISLDYLGRTTHIGGGVSMTFTDDYRYERAAYLLDRRLGLNMVPVVVLREIDGKRGALVEWVPDAINELERRERDLAPPDPRVLVRQRDQMTVFDALIFNEDRNLSNELITPADWKLHLIDHSRSFRLQKTLPKGMEEEPRSLSPGLHEALRSLDLKEMRRLLGDLLSKAQIKAMLARRDRILEKIEQDRKRFGDAVVFHEAAAGAGTSHP